MKKLLKIILVIFVFYNQNLYAVEYECLKKLKTEGYELIEKNIKKSLIQSYWDLGIDTLNTSRISKDAIYGANWKGLYPSYLNGDSFLSYLSGGEIAIGEERYNCIANTRNITCGPLKIYPENRFGTNKTGEKLLPESWNSSIDDYFGRDTVFINGFEYYAVGANNKMTINAARDSREPYISQYQPKLPRFPKIPIAKDLKVIDRKSFYNTNFQNGGWIKSLSNCSKEGLKYSFFLK